MRVFKPTYSKLLADQTREKRETANWYVSFRDHHGTARRIPAFTDKDLSEEFGRKLERLAALKMAGEDPDIATLRWLEDLPDKVQTKLVGWGLIDGRRLQRCRLLTEHITDFKAALKARGLTPGYIVTTVNQIKDVVKKTGAQRWNDISPNAVEHYLAQRRQDGISARTSNAILASVKSFCTWMVQQRRAPENRFPPCER